MDIEAMKSLLQVSESGGLKDTRYRVAQLPQDLSRIIGINGGEDEHIGEWFSKAKMPGIACVPCSPHALLHGIEPD